MRFSVLLPLVSLTFTTAQPHPTPDHPQNASPSPYSIQMALSIISRHQGVLLSTSDRSNLLQAGFTQKTFRKLVNQHPSHSSVLRISSYMDESVQSVIPIVSNATLDITFPLDRLSSGNGLVYAYEEDKNETYRAAYEALAESVALQPKNAEGSLWYYVYPNYTYLDGMYSLAPFPTLLYSLEPNDATSLIASAPASTIEFVVKQLDLAWQHTYQSNTGLLVHGYDASRRASWANNITGASEWVWGRSLGWFCMALIDTLDLLNSPAYPNSSSASVDHAREWLLEHLTMLMGAVVDARDSKTGAWWQIMDQQGREGNYIESSASAMFVYTLLRGTRLGYLDIQRGREIGKTAYRYLVDQFVVRNDNGTLGWNGTVSVCSLNSSATYEYYVNQPILYDSVLGSSAFVLASLEYERLNRTWG